MNFLADKSAFVRSALDPVEDEWDRLTDAGRIWLCSPTKTEILFSARSWKDYEALEGTLEAGHPHAVMPDGSWRWVTETQREMARGHHRSAGVADLLIAACAHFNGLTILHYDADFDAVAKVTGQPTRWLAPAGTL